jgi:hypothetical protein
VPPELRTDAQLFQAAVGQFGVRVNVFHDEPAARAWLNAYAGQGS